MPHKKRMQLTLPHGGLRISEFFRICRRAFQVASYEKLSLLLPRPGREPTTSRTPRLHNKQEVPHPTRSAIGRRNLILTAVKCKKTIVKSC